MPITNYPRFDFGRGGTAGALGSVIPAGMTPTVIDIGDSLTAGDQWTAHHWHMGVIGAPLESVLNTGFYGQSMSGCLTQITTKSWTAQDGSPGLVSAPHVGLIRLRIGTNNARGNAVIDGTMQGYYRSIIDHCLTKADYVIVYALPPVGGVTQAAAPNIAGWNAYLSTLPSIYPGQVWYVDDVADLKDGSGNIIPAYYDTADEVHISGAGQLQMVDTAAAQHAAIFANQSWASPLSDLASYPTNTNWVSNSTMTGTGGTMGGGWSGQVVTGAAVSAYGTGVAGTCSIVAADVGDTNTTPWQRITPSNMGAGAGTSVQVMIDCAGRSYGADDPAWLEHLMQIRFNAVDGTKIHRVRMWLQAGGQMICGEGYFKINGSSSVTRTATYRRTRRRTSASTTVTGAQTTKAYIYITSETGGTGSMGSIDIRCPIVRG